MRSECSAHIAIVSGYFNPIHIGHLRMMEAARAFADHLVVIVNNDKQQVLKKGKVIQPLSDRLEIVRALRVVDDAIPALDTDTTVRRSLEQLRETYPKAPLTFANGGDRTDPSAVPEYETCRMLSIEMRFGTGGAEKADASSRINDRLEPG